MVEPFPIPIPSEAASPFVEDELRLIGRLIDDQLVEIYYQPIVDFRSRSVFAYEALARPRDGYFRTPGDLIDAAVRAQCMGRLGRHLRHLAIRGCQRWTMFLNLNPHELGDPYLVQPDEPILISERPVYLEISEAVPTEFFDQCHSVLAELREKGVLLAIDDFGAGSASLKYIVDLQPDVVKIHRDLIIGCLPMSREFDLLASLTDLCHHMGAKVIAEGIETVEELKACLAADIDYGQGFLLSVPHNPAPSFFWPPELPPDSDAYLRDFRSAIDSDPEAQSSLRAATSGQLDSAAQAELASSRITIQCLEEELAETKNDLAESLDQRFALAERLKRLSLSTDPRPQRERRQTPSPAVPGSTPTAVVSNPKNSDGDDALDFLRQLEAQRAQSADSDR